MMVNPFESSTFGNSLSLRVDGAIGAMSLSPNGRDAVLAGRKGLFIIDLDDPFLAPRWLHHITSWEVADVQWSPHHAIKPSWCISTSNQKALLWDLARPSNNAIQNVLHRHVRAITDINFHPQDPELLATCSIDTFVYCWDMRSPRRPVKKWAEWRAGATQVKWNRTNPNQIASSHHHSFYLWDSRMGALPLLKIENAHGGKINGLDFNSSENRLITCSNDKTIKIWDLEGISEENAQPAVVINAEFPIARARSLPFGDDGCCGIMPLRGGDDAIHFLNYKDAYIASRETNNNVVIDLRSEVSFKGHLGPVKDFLWRVQHETYSKFKSKRDWKEFQLVTWSPSDCDLKLWPHDRRVYEMANYSPQHKRGIELLTKSSDLAELSRVRCVTSDEVSKQSPLLEYNSYITEPECSLGDMLKGANEDLLSRLALFEIKKSQVLETSAGQLNHLNWIFGVRMGSKFVITDNINSVEGSSNDGPANLGEEISIVGHKFPKIRFEKISVSTGHIILSLKGPLPAIPETAQITSQDLTKVPEIQIIGESTYNKNQLSIPSSSEKQVPRNTRDTANPSVTTDKNVPTHVTNDIALLKGISTEATNLTGNEQPSFRTAEPLSESKLTFMRIEIKFPKQYPHLKHSDLRVKQKRQLKQKKSNYVNFKIEETHELNETVRGVMLQNLNEISQFYTVKYNRYCLEPCLRYLLGDRIDLDDTLMLDNDVQLENDLDDVNKNTDSGLNNNLQSIGPKDCLASFVLNGNLNSDQNARDRFCDNIAKDLQDSRETNTEIDDEDIYNYADLIPGVEDDGGFNEFFEPTGSDRIQPSSTDDRYIKHNITPLPKACSAVWANSGQLVCFFMPKGSVDEGSKETGAAGYHQPRFGQAEPHSTSRIVKYQDFPIYEKTPKDKNEALNLVYSFGREDYQSDSELSEQSSDEISEDWDEVIRDDLQAFGKFQNAFKENNSLGLTRTVQAPRASFSRALSRKGTASISSYVDDSMLRSTKRAKGYNTCKHFIRTHDFGHLIPEKPELAVSYQLMGACMRDCAKINGQVAQNKGFKDLEEAWRLIEVMITSSELKFSQEDFNSFNEIQDAWGSHPFGHSWLVKIIFEYFQRQNNLQMLAMMSCVLLDSSVEGNAKDPSESCCQFESNISLWSHEKETTHTKFGLKTVSIPVPDNTAIDLQSWVRRIPINDLRQTRHSKSIAYSNDRTSSPTFHPSQRRAPEQSFSPSFYCTPTSENRSSLDRKLLDIQKRPPKKQVLSNKIQASFSGKTNHCLPSKRDKISALSVSLTISNSEELNLRAGSLRENLLSCMDYEVIAGYRENYAEMLYSWNLPYERIKMLKYNFMAGRSSQTSESKKYTCNYGVRNRRFYDERQQLLNPISTVNSANVNSWNTEKLGKIRYCTLCNQIATNRILFCLKCEHILHFRCAAEWWTGNEDSTDNACPTGCGCLCAASKAILNDTKISL